MPPSAISKLQSAVSQVKQVGAGGSEGKFCASPVASNLERSSLMVKHVHPVLDLQDRCREFAVLCGLRLRSMC
jgi:hypothetical protein